MSVALAPRRTQQRIAYAPDFQVQSDFETALVPDNTWVLFNLTEEDPRLEIIKTTDPIKHCSGRFTLRHRTLTKYARLTFSIYVEPGVLFDLGGLCMGETVGNDVLMLGLTEYPLPVTTLVWGKAGSAIDPKIFKSMALVKMTPSATPNQRIKLELVFEGSAEELFAEGYEFPECTEPDPAYFEDGSLTINSIDYLALTKGLTFTFDNQPPVEDRFTAASVNPDHIEVADERVHQFEWKVAGETGDAVDRAANTEPATYYPVVWQIGGDSDNVTITALSCEVTNSRESFEGSIRRSVLTVDLLATYVPGDTTTPVKMTRFID